jgi:putative alpha-1,2-mannosidase
MYTPAPDGYCGDEDNGQTSAWYVFSALGFYPVCPGTDQYVFGTPLFKKAVITLQNGKTILISSDSNSDINKYIQSVSYNGSSYTKNWLSHSELIKGAELKFEMTDVPNKLRGISKQDVPYSFSDEYTAKGKSRKPAGRK